MEFYFPQICGKLIPAVALDWTDFGGICFCGIGQGYGSMRLREAEYYADVHAFCKKWRNSFSEVGADFDRSSCARLRASGFFCRKIVLRTKPNGASRNLKAPFGIFIVE